jgi:hypothetical protein
MPDVKRSQQWVKLLFRQRIKMKIELTAEQVLAAIKNNCQDRECNIIKLKTIETIETKNQKIKNYETSSVFAPGVSDSSDGEKQSHVMPSAIPFGKDQKESQSQREEKEEFIPPVNSAPAKITYLTASLKKPESMTRTLNIDFRLETTAVGKFNKIVFSLTDRYREFFPNINDAHKEDWCYQQAWEYYHSLTTKERWIGKGRRRGVYKKGQHKNQKIKFGLSAVLELRKDVYVANVWISGNHFEFELNPTENARYPYRYDSKTTYDHTEYEEDGGWL